MKCPNCSFVNIDDIKTCRVCGFDLTSIGTPISEGTTHTNGTSKPHTQTEDNAAVVTPVTNDAKISKRRIIDDSEDEALDSAFKSIFGFDDDEVEDPLDVATVERMLQKKRHAVPLASEKFSENLSEDDLEEEDPYITPFEEDETIQPFSKNKVILMFVLSGMLLLLLALKIFWPGLPWKYQSGVVTTEPSEVESSEVESTTETVFTLGDDASLVPINTFFNLLPEFINRGNLSILGLFESSQEALDVLTSFAVIGNLEKIAEATLTKSEVTADASVYQVTTLTNRLIDGQQTQTASTWDFRAVLKKDLWILESVAVETGLPTATDTTEPVTQVTTEKVTEVTTEKPTQTTTESKTEPTTKGETTTEPSTSPLLNGFKSTGSFTGGELSSGQDIAFVRYGNHDTFERLAFDLYEWVGGKPDQSVDAVTSYSASISDDGRTIGIMVNGAVEAYASQTSLNLANSAYIESVYYNYFGNGEAVAITITLRQPSQFKVFNLISPGKLVVDIAPIE